MDAFIISSLPSLCWRHCKWQGPFAPQTLLRFIATTDPAATLSSSADFPVSPVIRPTLLRRFRAGTRRACRGLLFSASPTVAQAAADRCRLGALDAAVLD